MENWYHFQGITKVLVISVEAHLNICLVFICTDIKVTLLHINVLFLSLNS